MELSKETLQYWTDQDWKDLEQAETAKDMFTIAERIFSRMPAHIAQVCGPIGSGGLGSFEANLNAFNEEIKKLQRAGVHVFDQVPFEMPMQEIKKKMGTEEAIKTILDHFYMPIFADTKVSTFYFMPNWQSSKGATWEHALAQQLGKEIKYL
jgi:hypothetical protein